MTEKETVKGFSDFTGQEAEKRAKIRRIVEDNFRLYGFEPAETPIIEQEEFVRGENEFDEAVSDIFKLQDKGCRKLALRYEFTFQLKRIARGKKIPYKRYEIGPVFRDEPVSSNRFRQFTQCDVDIIGSEVKDEAEILALTKNIFDNLGIQSIINVNSRKLLNEILEEQKISNKIEVIKEIDKLDKISEKEIKKNLKEYDAESILKIFKQPEKYFEKYSSYSKIKELKKICNDYNIKINFLPSLARGLSYYNGSIFEVKTPEKKETIAGGGSYIINGIQSTGISFGLERISWLALVSTDTAKALIISINQDERAVQLAQKIRKFKIPCMIMYKKITRALDYANSKNIPYVIIAGENEKPKFKLKNMNSGKEILVTEAQIIKKLK